VLPAFFACALFAIVGVYAHCKATGSESFITPLFLFLGLLLLLVLGLFVVTYLQHRASVEAVQQEELLQRYRSSAGLERTALVYDAASQTARGTPMYGAAEATPLLFTATILPPSFVGVAAARGGGGVGGGASQLPVLSPVRRSTQSSAAQVPMGHSAEPSLPPLSTLPLPPLILSVGEDGVSTGLPLYGARSAEWSGRPLTVIPRFRWEPPVSLPAGAPAL